MTMSLSVFFANILDQPCGKLLEAHCLAFSRLAAYCACMKVLGWPEDGWPETGCCVQGV